MKCPCCNAIIADDAKFCPLCGGRISTPAGRSAPQQPAQPSQSAAPYEIYHGFQAVPTDSGRVTPPPPGHAGQSGPVYTQSPVQQTVTEQPKLKWFKFIIYFQLILNALSNFTSGLGYITGSVYAVGGALPEDIYAYFGAGLKACDVAMGIACVALAVFALFVRQRLAKFRAGAPNLYLALLGIGIAITLVYSVVSSAVTGVNTFTDVLSSLVGNIVLLVLNSVYFKKRSHLFVN